MAPVVREVVDAPAQLVDCAVERARHLAQLVVAVAGGRPREVAGGVAARHRGDGFDATAERRRDEPGANRRHRQRRRDAGEDEPAARPAAARRPPSAAATGAQTRWSDGRCGRRHTACRSPSSCCSAGSAPRAARARPESPGAARGSPWPPAPRRPRRNRPAPGRPSATSVTRMPASWPIRSASSSSSSGEHAGIASQQLGGQPRLGRQRRLDALHGEPPDPRLQDQPGRHRRDGPDDEGGQEDLAAKPHASRHRLGQLVAELLHGGRAPRPSAAVSRAAAARARPRCACRPCTSSPTRRRAAGPATARAPGARAGTGAAGTPWRSAAPRCRRPTRCAARRRR